METSGEKEFVKSRVRFWRKQEKTIGFVPTMGSLHEGHLTLVKKAREECDVVVVSIFVNPIQFTSKSDLEKYPRDLNSDSRLLQNQGVNLIFSPKESGQKIILPNDFQ